MSKDGSINETQTPAVQKVPGGDDESPQAVAAVRSGGAMPRASKAKRPRSVTGNSSKSTAPRLSLRPKEAAEAMGISERTLWTITADQTSGIPHLKLGGVILYPVADLQRWLSSKADGAA